MKRMLILTLVIIFFTGCVSNKAFREQQKKLQNMQADMAQNEEELVVLRKEIMQTRRNVSGNIIAASTADSTDIGQLNLQLLQNERDMRSLIHEHSELAVSVNELSHGVQEADQLILNRIKAIEDQMHNLDTKSLSPEQTAVSADEWSAYEKARDVYFTGDFNRAIIELDRYLANYPNSKYAGHAVYWKGESNYAMNDMPKAIGEFQTVISRYPKSWKVEDAKLKIGMCYMNMGDHQAARTELNKLKKDYPKYYRMDLVDLNLDKLK